MKSILLVETYPLVLSGLEQSLAKYPGLETLRICVTLERLEQEMKSEPPSLLILDHHLLEEKTLSWIKKQLHLVKNLPVLILSTDDRPATIRKFMKAGCWGYLLKNVSEEELYAAISEINRGNLYLQAATLKRISFSSLGIKSRKKDCRSLTKREREILTLIIEEFTTKEIAAKLFISDCTVETHRLKLIHKLGVKNTAGLVREALQHQLYPEC